jgi:hypothetical protein
MPHEPSDSCPPVQQAPSKCCPACGQPRPLAEFATTLAGHLASCCRTCRRATARLTSRRRAAAMRLLIAAHPEEWAGLLGLVRGCRQLGTNRPKRGGRDAA